MEDGGDGREAGRFHHMFATWAIENHARELDLQYLRGHSTAATYDAAKAAAARILAAG